MMLPRVCVGWILLGFRRWWLVLGLVLVLVCLLRLLLLPLACRVLLPCRVLCWA